MTASPEQLHEMLMSCINFSRTMLEKAGDFYPFGATLSAAGQVGTTGAYNGEERPQPQEIYRMLAHAYAAGARSGEFLGVALAANVNIPAQFSPTLPDGVRVHLESSGFSRFVYIPYKISVSEKNRTVEMHEPFSVQIEPQLLIDAGHV